MFFITSMLLRQRAAQKKHLEESARKLATEMETKAHQPTGDDAKDTKKKTTGV